jgi:hypothetical protein
MPGNFSAQGAEPVTSIKFFCGEVVKRLCFPHLEK